jgi:glycosyltransferase involved in cell wall biosynthesis
MRIVHLTASFLFGGPERQMLDLGRALPGAYQSSFVSFAENGSCRAFLDRASESGFTIHRLGYDFPRLLSALRELIRVLRGWKTDLVCCHGYKANLVGALACRRLGIPAIAVSRGWTGQSRRVRLYEALDRRVLRWMSKVVCVSHAQAAKVREAGVPDSRITVIHNAIQPGRFANPRPEYRDRLRALFPVPPAQIVGSAGRLSPEKGFDVLVDAAAEMNAPSGSVGFVLFGDGPMHESLTEQIRKRGLGGRFVLAGFHDDLDAYLPHLDLFALPSYTEGLPNVILEAFASGVPVVATAVGGTPEIVDDGVCGWLVPPGQPRRMAERMTDALNDRDRLRQMASRGGDRVRRCFSFAPQAQAYRTLFHSLCRTEVPAEAGKGTSRDSGS